MDNQIIVKIEPGVLNQYVYIFTDRSELTPLCQETKMENLLSVITKCAAQYDIKKIKLSGAHEFTIGIKNQLTEKLTTCFEKADEFNIELL